MNYILGRREYALVLLTLFLVRCFREKDTDIDFAQDAIDEYKVRYSVPYMSFCNCT
jgi:hypothetical protein